MPEGKKIKIEDGSESQENSTEGVNSHDVGSGDNQKPKIEPVDTAQNPESEVVKDLRSKLETKTGEAEENYDRLLRVSAEASVISSFGRSPALNNSNCQWTSATCSRDGPGRAFPPT